MLLEGLRFWWTRLGNEVELGMMSMADDVSIEDELHWHSDLEAVKMFLLATLPSSVLGHVDINVLVHI